MIHIIFWSDYVTQLAWERLGSVQGEGSLGVPAQTAAPATWSDKRMKMDGWMDGHYFLSPGSYQLISTCVLLASSFGSCATSELPAWIDNAVKEYRGVLLCEVSSKHCQLHKEELFAAFNEILTVTHTSFLECIALVCAYPAYFMFK